MGLAILLLSLTVIPAAAIGLGVGPSILKIEKALSGKTYERAIFVFNSNAEGGQFGLTAIGEIADWVSFYTIEDRSTPIKEISIPANSDAAATVKFNIPQGAAKPVYQGRLIVTGEPIGNDQQVKLQMEMPIEVVIEIAGPAEAQPGSVSSGSTLGSQTAASGEGKLINLSSDRRPSCGDVATIRADFENGTPAEIRAMLAVEVYLEGKLVKTLKGEETVVLAAGKGVLTAYFQPQQEGNYRLVGHINYAGKQTPAKELHLSVGGQAAETGSPLPIILALVATIAFIIIMMLVLMRLQARKRQA